MAKRRLVYRETFKAGAAIRPAEVKPYLKRCAEQATRVEVTARGSMLLEGTPHVFVDLRIFQPKEDT